MQCRGVNFSRSNKIVERGKQTYPVPVKPGFQTILSAVSAPDSVPALFGAGTLMH